VRASASLFLTNQPYEHQSPLASVAWLIGLHLPGPGLPVVPHWRQIQWSPCWSTKTSRQGCEENCVQQPEKVQSATTGADEFFVVAALGIAESRPVGWATIEARKKVKRTRATVKICILRKVIRHILSVYVEGAGSSCSASKKQGRWPPTSSYQAGE
jgi:hypothetical protein